MSTVLSHRASVQTDATHDAVAAADRVARYPRMQNLPDAALVKLVADPPALTPVTAGTKIAAVYAGSQQSSTLYGAPSGIGNFSQARVTTGTGGKHAIVAVGDADWTSGAFNPAVPSANDTGTSNTNNSWAALTLALRPAYL